MKKLAITLSVCLGLSATSLAHAYDFTNQVTADGVEYGFHQGEKDAPLLIAITTDIKESMTDVYSPVGGLLAAKGYSIAAIDVTCHGKDLKKKERYGLDCWRTRADASHDNIFGGYIQHLKSVISDIDKSHRAETTDITALGVSRGGYLAMKAAAEIPQINSVIALAPVTEIFRLREFDGATANKSLYSLEPLYRPLSEKNLFIQINNSDDRVGTYETLRLIEGVTKAGDPKTVNLTAIITPRRNHSTSEHQAAASWAIEQHSKTSVTGTSAPK